MKLIDKDALVAEIEKLIDRPAPSHGQQCPWEDGYYCGLYKAESIIDDLFMFSDSIKLKEVDLENEIKLRLFESIASNSQNLCDTTHYMTPQSVANNVNGVYNILFNKNKK